MLKLHNDKPGTLVPALAVRSQIGEGAVAADNARIREPEGFQDALSFKIRRFPRNRFKCFFIPGWPTKKLISLFKTNNVR